MSAKLRSAKVRKKITWLCISMSTFRLKRHHTEHIERKAIVAKAREWFVYLHNTEGEGRIKNTGKK